MDHSLQTGIGFVARWLNRGIDLLYPRNCLICSTPLEENERGVVCAKCLATAKRIEPPFCQRCALPFDGKLDRPFVCGYCHELKFHFHRTISACRAEGVVRESIHRFKYNKEMYFGAHLSNWLIDAARQLPWSEISAIVPVPLFPRKQRTREFNQAEYLARAMGRSCGVPVISGKLLRIRETVTQTALDAKARAANLRGAFAAKSPDEFAGKRLALVDDVFTTGATLDGCAKILLKSGAREVTALTVARGV